MISTKNYSYNYTVILPGFKQGLNYQKDLSKEDLINELNPIILTKDFKRLNDEEKRFVFELCNRFIEGLQKDRITVEEYRSTRNFLVSLSKDSLDNLKSFLLFAVGLTKEEKIETVTKMSSLYKTTIFDIRIPLMQPKSRKEIKRYTSYERERNAMDFFEMIKELDSYYNRFISKFANILTKEPQLFDYVRSEILNGEDFQEMVLKEYEFYFSFMKEDPCFRKMYELNQDHIFTSLKNKVVKIISLYEEKNNPYNNYIKKAKAENANRQVLEKSNKVPYSYRHK